MLSGSYSRLGHREVSLPKALDSLCYFRMLLNHSLHCSKKWPFNIITILEWGNVSQFRMFYKCMTHAGGALVKIRVPTPSHWQDELLYVFLTFVGYFSNICQLCTTFLKNFCMVLRRPLPVHYLFLTFVWYFTHLCRPEHYVFLTLCGTSHTSAGQYTTFSWLYVVLHTPLSVH